MSMEDIFATILPNNTCVFRGTTYHSAHFENHTGKRVRWDGNFRGGKYFTIAETGRTIRVAPLGQELPKPVGLDAFCIALGLVDA